MGGKCPPPKFFGFGKSKFVGGDSHTPPWRNASRHEQRFGCTYVYYGRVRERKCTSRLERYRRSDIAGSLPVELRRSEKFV